MERFRYVAFEGSGSRIEGALRSASRRDALAQLLSMGYHPVSLRAAAENAWDVPTLWRRLWRRVPVAQLAALTRQLAALLRAGVPVIEALAVLRRQCSHKGLAAIVGEVEETLRRHAGTLTAALAEHPRVFDPVYCGLVRSGEEGGNLVEVLDGLAIHLNQSARVRSQVLTAFIYPIFLVVMGAVAIFVLMTFVIPQFQVLFESFGQQLPWTTRILIAVSGFLHHWWWMVLGLVGLAGGLGWSLFRRPGVRERWHRLMLRLPVMGSMLIKLEAARICRTLAALLGGGVRVVELLLITSRTVKNAAVGSSFAGVVKQVTGGNPLGDAFEQAGLYPPLMISLIRTGEQSGQLPQMLKELSEVYQQDSEHAINDAVKLLEPLLIMVMGLGIAGIVAAVILPIFRANMMAT